MGTDTFTSFRYTVSVAVAVLVLLASAFAGAGHANAQQHARMAKAGESRVVSIGGSITEIVYALGAQDRLVAVDSTSRHPAEARDHPNVGYMRQLSAEPLLALDPGLLLAIEDTGPAHVLDQLRAAGTRLVMVPDDPSPQGVLEKIEVVAEALGLEGRGRQLVARLELEFAELDAHLAATDRAPKVLFLLSVGSGVPLAAGRDTSAAGIVELAGGTNAVTVFEGFKPLSPEAAVAAAPEILLVTKRTLGLLGGPDKLLARPELAATPAGHARRFVEMDGLLLLGFGPRTPQAIRELAAALHPELSLRSASD